MRCIAATRLRHVAHSIILDVRETGADGEAPFAAVVRVPMSEIADRLLELPSDTLYVLCEDGLKSRRVAAYLEGEGFDAIAVDGGLAAIDGAGLAAL